MGNYWQKQLWLTRSLRGPYADVRAQLRKNQSGYVKLEYIIPVTLLKTSFKKTIQSELTPPLRQQCWQKMLTQAYAHQCFAYATGPYKDPNTKHKHRGLERGSHEVGMSANGGSMEKMMRNLWISGVPYF